MIYGVPFRPPTTDSDYDWFRSRKNADRHAAKGPTWGAIKVQPATAKSVCLDDE